MISRTFHLKLILISSLLLLPANIALCQVPQLSDPIQLTTTDGEPIDVGENGFATPFYADVDGDDVPDLLVGEFKGGGCRVYHNYGTATQPVFKDFKYLQAEGVQATVPFG